MADTMPSDPNTLFSASYDSTTKWISAGIFALLLVIAAVIHSLVVGCLSALLLVGAYAWSPRGYTISQRSIIVKRLIGNVRIPLDGIRELRIATQDDFRGCIRTFANGGLFGYYGQFRTSKLGRCTWYVTSQSNAVVVIAGARTTVFSPDEVDGFLAAIRASAPVPPSPPGEPLLNSLQSYDAGIPGGMLVGGAIAIAVMAVMGFAALYAPGPPSCTLTADSLTIHDRFYPVTVPAGSVDVEHIRLVNFDVDTEWRPTARTNGFANAHYRSGWFRVASGKTVRMYRADSTRLVLLPPKGDGAAVLLETSDPEKFLREVRQEWAGRS
jgi:Bacterial PH domain